MVQRLCKDELSQHYQVRFMPPSEEALRTLARCSSGREINYPPTCGVGKEKLLCILLLSVLHYSSTEEATKEADDRISNKFKPPDKLVLQKSEPYPEKRSNGSFMSRLASWINPFGGSSENTNDLSPAAGSFGGPQYLPPPSLSQSHIEKDCSLCNQEPWIPVASNIGHQSIINFLPPAAHADELSSHGSDLNGLYSLHPPPIAYNEPPQIYRPPPQFRPKFPKSLEFSKSPSLQYELPPSKREPVISLPPPNKDEFLIADYMLPPPINYRIPSLIYGPPKPVYIPPPKPIYGPPPKPIYRIPTKPIYGPPKPIYGPPPQHPFPNTPLENYGPPPPQFFQPPPPASNQYGAPSNIPLTYLRPVAESFTPPASFNNYGPPPLSSHYIPTPISTFNDEATNKHLPPAIPSDSYGAPVTGDDANYLAPTEQLPLPSGDSPHLERPIPLPNLSSVPVAPIHNFADFNQGFNNPQEHYQDGRHNSANGNVEIQESVKIADYLAAIEHPINLIQSPIVEVSVKDNNNQGQHENHNYQESSVNYEHTEHKSYQNSNDNSNLVGSSGNTNQALFDPESKSIGSDIYSERNTNFNNRVKTYNNINEQIHENTNAYGKLSENPIVVEDVYTSASNINNTVVSSNEKQFKRTNNKQLAITSFTSESDKNNLATANVIKDLLLRQTNSKSPKDVSIFASKNSFTTPTLDYGRWIPSENSMTTNKPKRVQIIVPYVTDKKQFDWSYKPRQNTHLNNTYTTLLPVYTPPSSTEISVWMKFAEDFNLAESNRVTATAFIKPTTAVYNIQDILPSRLPYDVITLQKNIDDWTQQAYSNAVKDKSVHMSTEKLLSSKKIPDEYFTTQQYASTFETTTFTNDLFDHDSASSVKNETIVESEDADIETNLILASDTTTKVTTTTTPVPSTTNSPLPSPFSPKGQRSLWDVSHVTVSPQTKEKVYVVTPQAYTFYTSTPATAWSLAPKIENGRINNASTYDSYKFSIRVEPQNKTKQEKLKEELKNVVKIVYSEWPHLINNLQTTTGKPTSRHPLFGLMDISAYTPPPNSTVETFSGHSRVASVVTSPSVSVPKKKTTQNNDKKITIKATNTKTFT